MWVIAGLGNPGKHYARHRHNIGFMAVNQLARNHSISLSRKKFKAVVGQGKIAGHDAIIMKPQEYMNASGESISALLHFYRILPSCLIVVVDDMDLELGRLRIRKSGSSGGHRGLESIITRLGTPAFTRLRIGIGRPPQSTNAAAHVLDDFSSDERGILRALLSRASGAIEHIVTENIDSAMNQFNN